MDTLRWIALVLFALSVLIKANNGEFDFGLALVVVVLFLFMYKKLDNDR